MTSEFKLGDRVQINLTGSFSYTPKRPYMEGTLVVRDGDTFLCNDFSDPSFYGTYSDKYGNCLWFHKRRFTPVQEEYNPLQNGDTDEDV